MKRFLGKYNLKWTVFSLSTSIEVEPIENIELIKITYKNKELEIVAGSYQWDWKWVYKKN